MAVFLGLSAGDTLEWAMDTAGNERTAKVRKLWNSIQNTSTSQELLFPAYGRAACVGAAENFPEKFQAKVDTVYIDLAKVCRQLAWEAKSTHILFIIFYMFWW